MKNLVWLRSDLRIADNRCLKEATQNGEAIACIFLPTQQLRDYGHGENKIDFLRSCASSLHERLNELGVRSFFQEVENFSSQINLIQDICKKEQINTVYWNDEYPLDERKRDAKLHQALLESGIEVNRFQDSLIIPPGQINNNDGQMYRVFTPFKRAWLGVYEDKYSHIATDNDQPQDNPKKDVRSHQLAARKILARFCEQNISDYKDKRDYFGINATSELSAHLSAGTISPRRAFIEAIKQNNGELHTGNPGILTWISQLIWREFYYHLIARNDALSKNMPFQPKTDQICWNPSGENFVRWCEGQTGIPIVDAGMRQLNQTGWMHNRLRMVTAMFLTKNLLIDWRLGERYFLEKLKDGDFALNNGGWQWSASTGTDAAPYFRIFNPFSQAKKFDPEAIFIKAFVPELKKLPAEIIHNEEKLKQTHPDSYPAGIVDCKESRKIAIQRFSEHI